MKKTVSLRDASKLDPLSFTVFFVCFANPDGATVRTAAWLYGSAGRAAARGGGRPMVAPTKRHPPQAFSTQQADCEAIASAKRIEKEPEI